MPLSLFGTLARALEAPLVLAAEPLRPYDAIILLGAPLGPGDQLTAPLAERVEAAAELWHAGGAPVVVATGGITQSASRAEADVMAEALRARGVDRVIVERDSRTTAENAWRTAELVGRGPVWLVTQPFHGRRAARLFRAAGFEPHVWHIANSLEYRDRRRAVRWLTREYAAWAKLLLRRDHER